ncbi:hypothetical protein ACOPW7_004756, partial [Escherichia coli]
LFLCATFAAACLRVHISSSDKWPLSGADSYWQVAYLLMQEKISTIRVIVVSGRFASSRIDFNQAIKCSLCFMFISCQLALVVWWLESNQLPSVRCRLGYAHPAVSCLESSPQNYSLARR